MEINIRRNTIVFFIVGLISLLLTAHIAGLIWKDFLGHQTGHDLIKRIDINEEGNISTWFSSAMLLLCAFLLGLIGVGKRMIKARFAMHWISLALVFAFLSCDETAQIHEWTVAHIRRLTDIKFFQFIGWVIPYSILVALLGIIYLPFFFHLPSRIRFLFAASGFVYVGGALGMELLTGAIGRVVLEGKLHFLFEFFEEVFEMGGIVLFIYTLLTYLSDEFGEIALLFKADAPPDKL